MPDWGVSNGLLASIAAAGVSTLGLLSMAILGDWAQRNSASFSAFTVGLLTVAIFFHLIPEAITHDPGSWRGIVVSFAFLASLGLVMRLMLGVGKGGDRLAFGFASVIALGFHSFVDGVIYEATFLGDVYTGWIATFGLLLHEFPEGVIAYFLMREGGLGRLASTITAFVVASLTTILGALAGGLAFGEHGDFQLAYLLSITSGALAYIVVFHLGPHASFAPRNRGYIMAGLGVVIATLAEILRHGMGGH